MTQNVIAEYLRTSAQRQHDVPLHEAIVDHATGPLDRETLEDWGIYEPHPVVDITAGMMKAYATLPDTLAELLYERIVERKSWHEIASSLATTEAGAKRRFQRAQERLRGLVEAHLRELPPSRQEAAQRQIEHFAYAAIDLARRSSRRSLGG